MLSRRHGGSGGRERRLSDEDCEKLIQKAREGKLRTIWDGVEWAREEAGVEYTYWGMRHVFERLDLKKLELKKKVPRQQSPARSLLTRTPMRTPPSKRRGKKGADGAP